MAWFNHLDPFILNFVSAKNAKKKRKELESLDFLDLRLSHGLLYLSSCSQLKKP
jgi:hypothetical protein